MFEYFMVMYGNDIINMIIVAVFGMLGVVIKNIVKKYLNEKIAQDVVKAAVLFVEQCFNHLHGKEKLDAAVNRASEVLTAKGIKISAVELETLIEAAVAEFNEAFKK